MKYALSMAARWLACIALLSLACAAEPDDELTPEDLSAECVATAECLEAGCSAELDAYDEADAASTACESACSGDDACAEACLELDDAQWDALYACIVSDCAALTSEYLQDVEPLCSASADPPAEYRPDCGTARGVTAFRRAEDAGEFCAPEHFEWL